MWYKLTWIYVWADKVRPTTPTPILELSTDLTQCSSLVDVTAEWWTGIAEYNSWSYTLANGNGLEMTSWSNYVLSLYYQLSTPLTTSNKVVMHCTGYGYDGSYSWNFQMLLSPASWDAWGTGSNLSFYDNWTWIKIDNDATDKTHWDWYGDFNLTITMDFSTWEITYTGTTSNGSASPINLTRTMDATQIQNAISRSYLDFQLICYGFYPHRIESAELTIY